MKTGKETPRKMASGLKQTLEVVMFIRLCEVYNIAPTKRQLSKYRNKKGRLYNAIKES